MLEQTILDALRLGSIQDRACELPRILLPRTPVNKLPVNAPDSSGWHHGCCCRPLEKPRVGQRRRTSMSAEENMALVRRFWEARVVKRDLDAVDEMLAPDFVNHNKSVPGQKPDREDYL